MNKISEDVIPITVNAGTSTKEETRRLNPGRIVGVRCFTNNVDIGNTVRAEITDSTGLVVSKLQHLDNYKPVSGGSYLSSSKPLNVNGGESYKITIIAANPFGDTFSADFIFVYSDEVGVTC